MRRCRNRRRPPTTGMVIERPRRIKRAIHGVFLLDKPRGLSSNQALLRVRALFQAEKAGHTGTLDPLADGLLPICLGEASKFSSWQLEANKTYRASICLGIQTTTGDAEGDVVQSKPVPDSLDIASVIERFRGDITQIPPMYSALKVQGKPLYAYAREGISLPRQPRQIQISALRILAYQLPQLDIEVSCSAGTYIRTLAEDIGHALGCGAHLTALTRIASGGFALDSALSLDRLEAMELAAREACLLPPDILVAHLPTLSLSLDEAKALKFGRQIVRQDIPVLKPGICRVYDENGFMGLIALDETGCLKPQRLMRTDGKATDGKA